MNTDNNYGSASQNKDIIKKLAYTYTEANFKLYLKSKNFNQNDNFKFNEIDQEELKKLNEYYWSSYNYLSNLYNSTTREPILDFIK